MSFLDSKRIIGTNTQRVGADAISGGWKELGRTTASGGGTDVTVSSLSDKRYYMILSSWTMSTSAQSRWRFNNDTGSNYTGRYSSDGGTDATATSQSSIPYNNPGFDLTPHWNVSYIANKSDKEKLWINNQIYQNTAGAGTAPGRQEQTCKWANTSDVINEIRLNSSAGTYDSGSELVVLGWDPNDTHTDNFWEELDDSSWSSGSSWTSGTFTAKKYLWVQFYTEGGAGSSYFRFNGDSGNNYANRYSINGGSDSTIASQPESYLGAIDGLSFHNLFIINNASNEKLFTHQRVSRSSAGAGTAPTRNEGAGKWSNTSDQITSITVTTAGGGNFTAGNMKVWGSN